MSEKENNTKTPIAKNDSVKADHEQQKSVSLENAPKTESASKQQENVPKEKESAPKQQENVPQEKESAPKQQENPSKESGDAQSNKIAAKQKRSMPSKKKQDPIVEKVSGGKRSTCEL